MTEPSITDLWEAEDVVWSIEDRQIAIEAAFTALLVTLYETGAVPPVRLLHHLQGAARQVGQGGELLAGAAAALDELTQHIGGWLPPAGGIPAGMK